MTPLDLLRTLRIAGLTQKAADGKLTISPHGKLTNVLRDAIKEHREKLIVLIEDEGGEILPDLPEDQIPLPSDGLWAFVLSSCKKDIHETD